MTPNRPPLPDQAERDRFCHELETNFSVIAPAGVGKTTSIVDRIVAIAEADRQRPDRAVLPHLVVVTYTRKAADEMFSRVRTALDEARPHPQVQAHLAQAFFGTIHSFCQRLLAVAGPLCGIPGEVEIVTGTARLWQQFRLDEAGTFPSLPPDLRRAFAQHGQWEDVFKLAESWPGDLPTEWPLPGLPPRLDASPVLTLEAKGRGRPNIELSQARLRRWLRDLANPPDRGDPAPCPEPAMAGSAKALTEAWRAVFGPLRKWRAETTRYLAAQVAANYARFRRRTGQFTFDDLIQFAQRVLDDPEARDLVRHRQWRVILDEAQDTDPTQFTVLTELTRAPGSQGHWLDGAPDGPQPGHFCMVGDPQQSIYSDRADLGRYLHVHESLIQAGGAQATFSVTMRCPVRVVEALNATCPDVLRQRTESSRQVEYVPLANPVAAREGQVVRLPLPLPTAAAEPKAPLRQAAYARAFANWWKDRTPADFGTNSWNQVAILCPRNAWIDALGGAFLAVRLPVRQLSRRAAKALDPIHAWYAALLTIFAHPRDHFEIYGVLRDIFGCADSDLAAYVGNHDKAATNHPLRLDCPPADESSPVGSLLASLHALWLETRALPLYEGVENLIQKCQLSARLALVPGVEPEAIDALLDRFRQETAAAEAKQLDLVAWAAQQRLALEDTLEGEERSDEAITLLTAHKSKGLGFDVVVLPFFFRKFATRHDEYPCFEKGVEGSPRVLFDAADRTDEAREVTDLRRQELHERLLYVALTRVKRTLVLVDDAEWWSDLKRQSGDSWAELLQIEEAEFPNRRTWLRLPDDLQTPPDPIEPLPAVSVPVPKPEPAESTGSVLREYWRRRTPSSLQEHDAEQARAEPDALSDERFPEEIRQLYLTDPAAYGNWWHDSMETAPWSLELDAFRLHCSEAMARCPDPARGAEEMHRLFEAPMLSQLLDASVEVHTEVPFLWGDPSQKTGYEGYIDLLAINRSTGEWLVLDWKTDRMPGEEPAAALRRAYAPQVAIYHRAATDLFKRTGTVGLYSTVSGEWMEIDVP